MKRSILIRHLLLAAGFVLFIASSQVHAGEPLGPVIPKWYGFEMAAIMGYESGIKQVASDPQDALTTLLKAQQNSRAAFANGGSGNLAVQHNDHLIAQAILAARADLAKASAPGDKPAEVAVSNHPDKGNYPTKPSGFHVQATGEHQSTPTLVHRNAN